MICPNCANPCDDDLRYCDHCGSDLAHTMVGDDSCCEEIPVILVVEKPIPSVQEPVTVPTAPPAPVPKQGRLWPPLLALALMICIGTALFFLLPGTTQTPGNTSNIPDSCFSVNNGVLSFHAEFYNGPAELEIPATWNGQKVTAIADYAFIGTDSITTVILPESVVHIGDYAFSSCKNLRGIYIPITVRSIGVYAFADCESLEAIYLPGSLKQIGHDALSSCDSLRYILFDGTYSQWTSLYNGFFVTAVELHTQDGVYRTHP